MVIVDQPLPRFIVRGIDTTLTLSLQDEDGNALTVAGGGTVDIFFGGKEIITAGAVTVGPPASYTLLASAYDANESLIDRVLEVWDVTVGGVRSPITVHSYFLRREIFSHCTLGSLRELHPRIDQKFTDVGARIVAAHSIVMADAITKGLRPQLIMDAWILRNPTRFKALELIFQDAAHELSGEGQQYQRDADDYRNLYTKWWDEGHSEAYDWRETGTINPDDSKPVQNAVFYTNRPPFAWTRGR